MMCSINNSVEVNVYMMTGSVTTEHCRSRNSTPLDIMIQCSFSFSSTNLFLLCICEKRCNLCYLGLLYIQAGYCIRTDRLTGVRSCFFFFQAEDGIRDHCVTGVQTCALPILGLARDRHHGLAGIRSRMSRLRARLLRMIQLVPVIRARPTPTPKVTSAPAAFT